ncbi:hypothetical protein FD42_GL001510 [Lentilactobacillus hilgardii DSM 20176 = ATCC 8290]|nr:hypothetical protein FD42_GL001510 [Lentilactobacillus hilgardii DSM 20176 = ATCC 8290]
MVNCKRKSQQKHCQYAFYEAFNIRIKVSAFTCKILSMSYNKGESEQCRSTFKGDEHHEIQP